jgi:hypothetical protein
VDIEGAEAVVFSGSCEHWLDRVDHIAIELHDDSAFGPARAIFTKAITGRGFTVRPSSELTVCRGPATVAG